MKEIIIGFIASYIAMRVLIAVLLGTGEYANLAIDITNIGLLLGFVVITLCLLVGGLSPSNVRTRMFNVFGIDALILITVFLLFILQSCATSIGFGT